MKKIIYLFILLAMAAVSEAQVVNEFRIQTLFQGKTENGLRKFHMTVETNSTGKWKVISKATITTGRNLEMATVKPDSTVSGLPFNELLKNTEFHKLYEISLNDLMDRIDAPDQEVINRPKNETDHKIFRDGETKNIVVSIKAGEKDNEAIIRVFNFDNSKLILLNKGLRSFSGNILEVGTSSFAPGNYIVVVSTPSHRFSEKFIIY